MRERQIIGYKPHRLAVAPTTDHEETIRIVVRYDQIQGGKVALYHKHEGRSVYAATSERHYALDEVNISRARCRNVAIGTNGERAPPDVNLYTFNPMTND